MPESTPVRPRGSGAGARLVVPGLLAAGVALSALAGLGGAVAALAMTLAQPAFALAVAGRRGRTLAPRALPAQAMPLLLAWADPVLPKPPRAPIAAPAPATAVNC